MITGSGIERAVNCRFSSAGPRVWYESTSAATLGTAIHAYLEALANGATPEDAELAVAEEHRAACAELDVGSLSHDLRLSAEVTLVYSPATDTARVLGQALARDYSAVAPDEIPMTLDLVGVDLANHRGAVKDYKSGRGHVTPARHNWQTLGGAVALSRAYDLDEVDAEILFTRPGEPIRRSRHTHTTADLMAAARHLRIVGERAAADRATFAAGRHVEPTEGSWCRYCPCAWACPAKTGLVRQALAGELTAPTPADAVRLLPRLKAASKALEAIVTQVHALAAVDPIRVEAHDDGTETWFGEVIEPGNEVIDAAIAIPVAAAELGVTDAAAFITEVATVKVSKSALEDAAKARAGKGQGAATMRRVLAAIRAAGGASKPPRKSIQLYTVRPAEREEPANV